MRLKALLILGSISFPLSGCGAKAPDVTFCTMDSKNFLKHANDAQTFEDLKAIVNGGRPIYCQETKDGKQFDITLKEADKHITQPLSDNQKLRNYVLELERKVEQCR